MATDLLQKVIFDSQLLSRDIESESNKTFCKGDFWDLSLTWNTNDPDLTECFRDTILVGVPCAFLWCVGFPIWLWKMIAHSQKIPQDTNCKNIFGRSRLKGTFYDKRL